MKIMTLKRDPKNHDEVVVVLELAQTLRAVWGSIAWYGMWVFLGVALHRAFVYLVG